MSLPAEIPTVRLRLPLITADERDDMLAGRRRPEWHADYPREDDRDAVTMLRDGADPWGPRHIVRAFDGLVVGSIGFFGPPADRDGTPEAEVGYGLVVDARGHGAATEALRGLLALTDHGGVRVRASVLPDNAPSIRVLAKCGFTELRGANEDGELVMARPIPSA
ncbi:GNAT family N-acetyltransferase [Nocardioides ungokensis]|uniref:GNAT family N-acetyltransferase n=1 Tax=Nocardioides ungokensis TaxID=1643322 RepID=UPI001FE4E173|nr:GNAT family N-acetyltransferase [Nocardioides ungokensis]